jgi:mRNA interferase YafQ
MIEIFFEKSFIKSFKKYLKQLPALESLVKEKIQIFKIDPYNPILKTHKLSGKLKIYIHSRLILIAE